MRTLEVRRHSIRKDGGGSQLSQAGVDLARSLGATMGPFARVATSVVPRARETAIAMGFAVDYEIVTLISEEAMAAEALNPQKRREALGQILWALAGNEPGFEEATRALYAGDQERLIALTAGWPGYLPPFVREWK